MDSERIDQLSGSPSMFIVISFFLKALLCTEKVIRFLGLKMVFVENWSRMIRYLKDFSLKSKTNSKQSKNTKKTVKKRHKFDFFWATTFRF